MAHQTSLVGCGMRPFYTYTSVEYVVCKTGDCDEQRPHPPVVKDKLLLQPNNHSSGER